MTHVYKELRKKHSVKRRWNPEEDVRAKDLLLQGSSYSEVAVILGRTRKSVAHRNNDVWKIAQYQYPWTDQEERLAKEMLKNGCSYREVSKKLKRTITALRKKNSREWHVSNMKPQNEILEMTKEKAYSNWYRFNGKRPRCLERDNFTCQRCGVQDFSGSILQVHHKDGNGRGSDNPNNSLCNLETLCVSCHTKTHFSRKEAANA